MDMAVSSSPWVERVIEMAIPSRPVERTEKKPDTGRYGDGWPDVSGKVVGQQCGDSDQNQENSPEARRAAAADIPDFFDGLRFWIAHLCSLLIGVSP